MPLQLLPMEEADVPHYVDITWAAARGDLMGAMFPNGMFEDDRQWLIDDKIQAMRKHPETTKTMKIVDSDLPDDHSTGKIISVATWKIYPRERTEEEMEAEKKEGEERGHAPHASAPMLEAFFSQMGKCKREIVGKKAVVYLGILMTHPDHHRRGAGAMQLQWGFDLADELGLPVYLEASPMGQPLYARCGFETIKVVDFKPRDWGMDHDIPHVCMLRPGQMANGHASRLPT